MKKILFILMVIIASVGVANAQNNTSSPYSRYGIGELRPGSNAQLVGMGGAGIALQPTTWINYSNPAALAALPNKSSYVDFGLMMRYSLMTDKQSTEQFADFNFDHLAVAFPINEWWKFSFGMRPMSDVGYDIMDYRNVEGTDKYYQAYYVGKGGLNEIYMTQAFNVSDNFLVGGTLGYLWGTTEEQAKHMLGLGVESVYVNNATIYSGLRGELGLQFSKTIGSLDYTVGTVFKFYSAMEADQELTVIENMTGGGVDTVRNESERLKNVALPTHYGAGLGIKAPNKYQISIDYTFEDWSDVTVGMQPEYLVSSHTLAGGVEFLPKKAAYTFWEHVVWRGGLRYESGYLKVHGTRIENYKLTLGCSLPTMQNRSAVNLGLELGQKGSTNASLHRESYVTLHIGFSLYDNWFLKRKLD